MNTEFGRRNRRAADEREAPKKTWLPAEYRGIVALIGISTILGTASIALLLNKTRILAAHDPAYLDNLIIASDSPRLTSFWDFPSDNEEAYLTTQWMVTNFERICSFTGYPRMKDTDDDYVTANPKASNRYRTDVFGSSKSAEQVVALVAQDKNFCQKDNHYALYEYRLAWSSAAAARAERKTKILLLKARAALAEIEQSHSIEVSGSRTEPDMDIAEACRNKWHNDYEMQDYCRKQQEEARSWAKHASIDNDIAVHCTSEWPANWEMFAYCVKQQNAAKQRLE
jgi:hypothetical protein